MIKLAVEVTFIEEVLGTSSADERIHETFVASKLRKEVEKAIANGERFYIGDDDGEGRREVTGQDLEKMKAEEIAALVDGGTAEKGTTRFPHDEEGNPFMWDYQWKGFFKESCSMLRRADGFKSSKLKAYKKEIDGLVFVQPRRIPFALPDGGEMGTCQRPLRASTAQGERVALASSETVPAGSTQRFNVTVLKDGLAPLVVEWLQYGALHGTGQWRNSGKGAFVFRAVDARTGKEVASTY